MTPSLRRPPRASTRDLPRPRLVPRGRQALVTELMRLEHMRARVEKELAAWSEKECQARARLVQIMARLDLIYQSVANLHAAERDLTVVPGSAQPKPPEHLRPVRAAGGRRSA